MIAASTDGVDIIITLNGGGELWCRRARRLSDAQGAVCLTCEQVFDISTCPYWHWSKSRAIHQRGTGHVVTPYTILRGAPEHAFIDLLRAQA